MYVLRHINTKIDNILYLSAMKRLLTILIIAIAASSCVTTRQYNSLRSELIASQGRLEHSRTLLDEYADRSDNLARQNIQQKNEIAQLSEKLGDLRKQYERTLDSGKANDAAYNEQLARQNEQLSANSARMAELERTLAAREKAIEDIRKKVADALTGFEGKGLSITTRDGKVYISMDDKLIFKSGSFDVDPRGAEAVADLARVIAANPDINIMVEGHTDDVPYKGKGQLKDNLDLSAMRATAITRLLLRNADIAPTRIISAGRGEWLPLTMGTSADARSRNRRTEIILTPKVDELLQLISQ